MSQKITIKTSGYGVSFTELSDDELEAFFQEKDEVDDIRDIEVVSDLVDDSYYEYGFLVEEDLTLEVDGEDETEVLEGLLEEAETSLVDLADEMETNLLVYEAEEEIDCSIKVEKFDPKKFSFFKRKVVLPNKKEKLIVDLYYADQGFDNCDTTSSGNLYIIKKNGEIVYL